MMAPPNRITNAMHRTFHNDPYFRKLFAVAEQTDRIAIDDCASDRHVTYSQLFHAVCSFRELLHSHLPASSFDENGLLKDEGVFVCVLAPTSYEFVVSYLAILAIGAVLVPLPTGLMTEEAVYLINSCKSSYMVFSPGQADAANAIHETICSSGTSDFKQIPIQISQISGDSDFVYTLLETPVFTPDRPGLLLFTSGTTGPPKGVLHARRFFYTEDPVTDNPDDLIICFRPVFWMGGLMDITRSLTAGVRIEILKRPPTPIFLLERVRKGDLTRLHAPPAMWLAMMRVWEEQIATLSESQLEGYVAGFRQLRDANISAGMPTPSVKRFWENIRNGSPMNITYGITELGSVVVRTAQERFEIDKDIIGKSVDGCIVKLSNGNSGEILVKCPTMFLGYLDNEKATRAMFDDEGFFKTGDMAYKEGDTYVLTGRASSDFIRFYSYKVPALEVGSHLSELPYIAESQVFGIPDLEAGNRVAALVRLKTTLKSSSHDKFPLALSTLREDLSGKMSLYKLPTALRVLADDEEIPRTVSSKFSARHAIQRYFPTTKDGTPSLPDTIQLLDLTGIKEIAPQKAWDWSGLRR